MKKILYYVSGHGMGHVTRSIAIIEELKRKNVDVVIRTFGTENFFKNELPGTRIISGIVDVGSVIKHDGITIDKTKTRKNQKKWINDIERYSEKEKSIILKENPNLIVSDISVMPLISAKKIQKKSVAISNFTWFDLFEFLPQKELDILQKAYDCADIAFRLPFGTKMNHFKKIRDVGLVVRIPKMDKEKTRKKLGIKENEKLVTISLGKSQNKIKPKFANNIKVISLGAKIQSKNVIKNLKNIPGHEIVAASDLVICKCGYGFTSECVSNNIPFITLFSKNHNEQIGIIENLKSFGFNYITDFKGINNFDITNDFIGSIKPIKRIKVENVKVAEKIIGLI